MKRLTLWASPSGDNDMLILAVMRFSSNALAPCRSNNARFILN